ncbi:MAG: hypothetical protein NZ960_03175 [Candidatus Kapabacteria bacterium]|nr:hypothetical protein [Candidatus Kapabacteria bacterium]MDW8012338.1 hypothetical protein [Bacteroidota bacterium]
MNIRPDPETLVATHAVWYPVVLDHIEVLGPDALEFLHRMSTADLLRLTPGKVQATVFTTEKGRIKAVAYVVCYQRERLGLICARSYGVTLYQWLRRFLVLEEVRLSQPTQCQSVEVHGVSASAVLAQLGIEPLTDASSWGTGALRVWQGGEVVCLRVPPFGGAAYGIVVSDTMASALYRALEDILGPPLSAVEQEALRILAGIGRHGTEWTEDYNPLEAGLNGLISFSKGCYVGQEVIARIDTYGKLQRQLICLQSLEPLVAPAPIMAKEQQVGVLTSSIAVSWRQLWAGLGYVRREWSREGVFWVGSSENTVIASPQCQQPSSQEGHED